MIVVRARAVQNDTPMRNGLSHEGVRPPNTRALTGPDDPDCRVHAAWLAEVAKAGDGRLGKEAGGNPSVSTSSSAPTDRLAGEEVRFTPTLGDGRSGTKVWIGCIFAGVIAAVIAIPSYFFFVETWQQPTADPVELTSRDSMKPATPPMQNGSERPKLVVEPTVGAPGEPVPIGLALRGRANDAVVILRGLLPGMELSAGSAVTTGTWQLFATDLSYAWLAPPKDFVGSADVVAELRLPNAEVADRQTLHVKWARLGPAGSGDEHKHEQLIGPKEKEIDPVSPVAPATVQHPNDGEAITLAPPISAHSSQDHLDREEAKSARTRERNNLRRSSGNQSRGARFKSPQARDGTQAAKGFWDWSR
jgi:hypothetical protein